MSDVPASVGDLTAISNSIVAAHWQPEDAPWRRICDYCADGRCSAYDEAMQYLMDLRRRLLRIGTGAR